jgi:hypothetical protein
LPFPVPNDSKLNVSPSPPYETVSSCESEILILQCILGNDDLSDRSVRGVCGTPHVSVENADWVESLSGRHDGALDAVESGEA